MSWKYLFETRNRLIPPIFVQFQAWRLFLVRLQPDQDRTSDKELLEGSNMIETTFPPRNTKNIIFLYRDCTDQGFILNPMNPEIETFLKIDPTSCMYSMSPNYPNYLGNRFAPISVDTSLERS